MSQQGESSSKNKKEDPVNPNPKKESVKIRFALFFDGTLNNRTNIEAREKAELGNAPESYQEHGDGTANSYDNGRTNIAIMEPHVLKDGNYDLSFKIYIEGQGTFDGEGDSGLGYSMGSGESGVSNRASQGIERATKRIIKFLKDYPASKYTIKKVDIDVFGFSRGAATARNCIYQLLSWGIGYNGVFNSEYGSNMNFFLIEKSYELWTKAIEVKFAGLYDTVLSVNASQYMWGLGNALNQRAVARATKAIHLAAAEEHRQDFPLHRIDSAKAKGVGEEYYLPGVHSDVGGSYNLANDILIKNKVKQTSYKQVLKAGSKSSMNDEKDDLVNKKLYGKDELSVDVTKRTILWDKGKLIQTRNLTDTEIMRTSSEVNRIINNDTQSKLEKDRNWLIAQGWYRPEEIKIHLYSADNTGEPLGTLRVNRKNIRSAYSNIPLKIMADFARKNTISLSGELIQNADAILKNESDLKKLERKIDKYINSFKGKTKPETLSKPEDWLNDRSEFMMRIRNQHMHFSSKENIGYYARFSSGIRTRYYYNG